MKKKIFKRKELLLESVETLARREVWQHIAQTAQIIYGLCDWDCIKKFDFSINKLKESKTDQINTNKDNLRVVNIKHEVDEQRIMYLSETV